jgi:hypothetical protein
MPGYKRSAQQMADKYARQKFRRQQKAAAQRAVATAYTESRSSPPPPPPPVPPFTEYNPASEAIEFAVHLLEDEFKAREVAS